MLHPSLVVHRAPTASFNRALATKNSTLGAHVEPPIPFAIPPAGDTVRGFFILPHLVRTYDY